MITHVAIIFQGKLYSLPRPNRHHHVIRMIWEQTGQPVDNDEQGFLDEYGNFLNRKQALIHAVSCGQFLGRNFELLFSEDIW